MSSLKAMFAWVLLVPNEDYVGKALLAADFLRRQGRKERVLCFLGSSTCSKSKLRLDALCDHVVTLKPTEGKGLGPVDDFLMSVMDSSAVLIFKKIAVIHPQILIFQHSDSDSPFEHSGVLCDSAGNWRLICLDPASILNGGGTWSSSSSMDSLDEFVKVVGPYDNGGDDESAKRIIIHQTLSELRSTTHASSPKNELILVQLGDDDADEFELIKTEMIGLKVGDPSSSPIKDTTEDNKESSSSNWIAVVGMSCRFPGANSLEEYWAILEQGRNTASGPPPERASLCVHLDPSGARGNFLKCRVDHFDADFFGVAPSEAEFMDPQSRLTLEVSWEALEDAGIKPESLRGSSTGVFYGSWLQDYKEIMNQETPSSSDYLRKYMNNGFGCSAAKLSFFYGLSGPNISTESGCSSSIVAVDLAVESLLRGKCSLALAAGSNLILQWKEKKSFVWAPDGRCKTFDSAVDGYGRAEGVAVLVLKRYAEAVAANDRIYGLICGSGGVSQEGESASFGSPTVKSEASCMKAALSSARISPSEVDFIEAHGTGTAVGDPTEASAIVEAYSCTDESARSCPLYIASGKTNIGHTESCSGIAGIIKVLLSMHHETIPRHLNVSELNPKIMGFEEIGAHIPLDGSVPWPRNPARARVAAVSSFGITGTDVHMLLREAPPVVRRKNPPPAALQQSPPPPPSMTTVPHILCLSARSGPALEQLTQSYLNHLLEKQEDTDCFNLLDMAYTANACRTPHTAFRRVITGRSKEELEAKLGARDWVEGAGHHPGGQRKATPVASVCFTFPGAIGKMEMARARELYSAFPVFRTSMDRCDAIFRTITTTELSLLPALISQPESESSATERWAALIAVQYSLAQLWISWGVRPAVVMGHCLGEIAASMVAGVLSLEDGFRIISPCQRLAQLTADQPGEMLALEGDQGQVEQLIEKYYLEAGSTTTTTDTDKDQLLLEVAALNSKSQTVVAGLSHSIKNFAAFCSEQGEKIKSRRVPVEFPLHSSLIQRSLEECAREVFPTDLSLPTIPYISSVTGGLFAEPERMMGPDYLFRCFRNKIQFTAACATASRLGGIDVFLELGLGGSLSALTAENLASSGGGGVGSPACISTFPRNNNGGGGGGVAATLASLVCLGVDIDWENYYQDYPVSKVPLPHYPFQHKSYWFKQRRRAGDDGKKGLLSRMVCESELLHPLLGRKVSLAESQNALTFEVCLDTSSTVGCAQFIADHVIGDEIVFPAAGYLEMMLAAGTHCDPEGDDGAVVGRTHPLWRHHPISIQDFSISAPLLLERDGTTTLQTVIELETSSTPTVMDSRKVSVYSQREGLKGRGWKLHATGTLTTAGAVGEETTPAEEEDKLDLEEIMERVPLVVSSGEGGPEGFYAELASVGLNFGQSFRSMSTFWRDESEVLVEVQVRGAPSSSSPSGEEEEVDDDHHHLLHPILIDSMIQACFIGKELGQKLHVPVSIPRFDWFPSSGGKREEESTSCEEEGEEERQQRRRRFFVYSNNAVSSGFRRLVLADHTGARVAVMESPVLLPTSVEAVMAAATVGRGGASGGSDAATTMNTYQVSWELAQLQIPAVELPLPPNNLVSLGGDPDPSLSPPASPAFSTSSSHGFRKSGSTTEEEDEQGHPTWLAISEENDNHPEDFLEELAGRMSGIGRELLVLHCSSSSSDEDFTAELMKCSEDEPRRLEGILIYAGRQGREGNNCSSPEWQDRRDLLKALFTTFKAIGQRRLSPPLPRGVHLVSTGTWASGHEGDGAALLDPSCSALWGLARSARMEIPGLLPSKCIDLDPGASPMGNLERLWTELWLADGEPEVLHRQGLRYVRRLKVEKTRQRGQHLEYPLSSRFQISLPKSRAISDVRFVPKAEEAGELIGQQIEVELHSASLNFRDVLIVMKPTGSIFESISVLGFDYAGVVSRVGPLAKRTVVGQRFYGISTSESTIASHIVTEESHGIEIPPGLTFAEAATLPAVFLTVWYSMVEVAGLRRGQTVLVHAVTGGVGLAAIQLGKILGVEVIGTAGSPRKRNYARSLGLRHVFNSRDLSFGQQVRAATGGAGVDMVLNCLTGPGFKEASLELVKEDGGHFVELSKLDVWSEEEVRSRRPGVNYSLIWLPEVEPQLISSMLGKMNELVGLGNLRPLPMTCFLASQLPSALATLQRAKQLGKVIVDLPSFSVEQNRFVEALFGNDDNHDHDPHRTYLITGGLGAIGLAIAKWMVASQGARYLALVGRSAPGQTALEAVDQLREEYNATIVCSQADISSYEQCEALFHNLFSGAAGATSLPPLGGIHHCAGILADKLLVNQDWASFSSVLQPKADGLYNLHRLTAHLPLQFFVAHSSVSSTFGNVGQCNYAAGNAYMDALMEARVEAGLKGLVVNWGQWAAGMAEKLEMRWVTPFSTSEGIAALEGFLMDNRTSVVAAGHVRFPEMTKMFPAYASTFLQAVMNNNSGEKTKGKKRGDSNGAGEKAEPFLVQYNKRKKGEDDEGEGLSEEEKVRLIAAFIRESAASILGLQTPDEIEDDSEFSAMGMDSLMSIDFTNKLQSELPGVALGYIDMAEFGCVRKMGEFLGNLIN